MIAGIRLRVWVFCGVLLAGGLAVTALIAEPEGVVGPERRREAAGVATRPPPEASRAARARDTEPGQPTAVSAAPAWEESPGDATPPGPQADATTHPRTPERETPTQPPSFGGSTFGGGTALQPGKKPGATEPDDAPVPEEDDAPQEDEVEEYVRDVADETLVEMLVERRLFERPDEDEGSVYQLTDEFVGEMTPEERRSLLYGFMNPAGLPHELLSDYLGRPLP